MGGTYSSVRYIIDGDKGGASFGLKLLDVSIGLVLVDAC